jgi:hypothetical protein
LTRACHALSLRWIVPWLLLGIVSCATSYGPGDLSAGASSADATARMGPPTARYVLDAGGQRLEFARGPAGFHTYMLDFDANDRLQRIEQVLTEPNFLELRQGMSGEEVRRRIGTPSNEMYLPRQHHRLWSYRYETPFCIWFQVSVDDGGKVAELGHGPDPACDNWDSDR